jgi:RimJ/RimL family protein N-acetyltransferase
MPASEDPRCHSSITPMPPRPLALAGFGVFLEPLSLAHVDGLCEASADGELWTLNYTTAPGPGRNTVCAYVDAALEGLANGVMLPFAVVNVSGAVLGCTRFYDIDASVPTLAIGYTWYRASVQRTHVNTACKRLLLGHAFDALGMRTVYLHTSHANLRSQAAIERLGAHRDGVLRQHKRHRDGGLRDTVCYSMLDSEWPAIRDRLDSRLGGLPR